MSSFLESDFDGKKKETAGEMQSLLFRDKLFCLPDLDFHKPSIK